MRRVRSNDGASAVEFAIVLPLLVMFLFGIIVFGLAFARAQGMEATAREAARVASVARDVDTTEVEQAARDATPPFINSDHIDVFVCDDEYEGDPAQCPDDWCEERGDRVQVTVRIAEQYSSDYALSMPLWSGVEPDFESYGVFRCEAERE